jgi:hypothetical protein
MGKDEQGSERWRRGFRGTVVLSSVFLLFHAAGMEEEEYRNIGGLLQIAWWWKQTMRSDRSYLI